MADLQETRMLLPPLEGEQELLSPPGMPCLLPLHLGGLFLNGIHNCSLTNTLNSHGSNLAVRSSRRSRRDPSACGHRWCALSPSRINRTVACTLVQWQLAPQAHMRSGDIIEGLKEDHPLPQAFAVFAEAGGLATQWRQSLTQGQVHPFDQGGADREAQSVKRSAPSTTRVLSVSSLPCFFCLTNCP